jgi:multimeric flavodoxin WrbA
MEYEYISLAGKKIGGCLACTRCAADNRCKLEDDWNGIAEKLLKADAIVFGAPNYGGILNALGHACLERTFCFRHRGALSLKGKLGVAVSVHDKAPDRDMVAMLIQGAMASNLMKVVGTVTAHGIPKCYTCGFGQDCRVGSVVREHGVLEKLEPQHFPPDFEGQEDTITQAAGMGRLLAAELNKQHNPAG